MAYVSLPDYRAPLATDDNDALAGALATGKRVYLPAGEGTGPNGEYQLGAEAGDYWTPLAGNLVSGADLFGDGMGESRILQIGDYALLANSLSDDVGNNVTGVSLRDLTIENDVVELGLLETSHLVNIGGVTGFIAERVEFRGFRGDGIYIGSSPFNGPEHERHNEGIILRDCIFDGVNNDNRNGVSIIDCSDWLIENCLFVNMTASNMPGPIDVEPNQNSFHRVRNGRVVGCTFRNNGGRAVNLLLLPNSFFDQPITNISVEECTIEDSPGGVGLAGYEGNDAATALKDYGVSYRWNVIRNVAMPFLFSGALGVDFVNNRLEDCDMGYLGYTATNRKVRIVGNDFVRCGNTNGPAIVQDSSLTDCDVIGNRFLDCGRPDGAFGPIYFLRGATANIDRIRLNANRVESPSSPLRTTNFAVYAGGHTGTINSGNSQKTGNEFYNLASAMGGDNML